MSKQLIYSTVPVANSSGRKTMNPRFFEAPLDGVSKVFLNGNYPNIRAAYEAKNIPVADIGDMRALPGRGGKDVPVEEPEPIDDTKVVAEPNPV